MALHPDHPDYSVPTLGPISKESRLSWHSQLSNHGIPYTAAMAAAGIGFVVEDSKRLREPTWDSAVFGEFKSKFFPRGCRGHINTIEIYTRAPPLVDETLTVHISPALGLGPTYTETLVVAAGTGDAWRTITFNRMWNYDSLLIFIYSSGLLLQWAYDYGAPYDWYDWDPVRLRFFPRNWRLWARVNYTGETAGDVPVSGTLNVINIPSVAAGAKAVEGAAGPPDFVQFVRIDGAGKVVYMMWELSYYEGFTFPAEDKVEMRIEVDGAVTDRTLDWLLDFVSRIVNTPTDITFTEITTTENEEKYIYHIRIPWEFKRQFRVLFRTTVVAQAFLVRGDVYRSLIR